MQPSFQWKQPFSQMRPGFRLASVACTAQPVSTSTKWPACCQLTRCSIPAWLTTRWARRRTRGRSSSCTRRLRSRKLNSRISNLARGLFTSSTRRFTCLTFRSSQQSVAKRDLRAGELLDGIGGFCTYGLIDNAKAARAYSALPISLSEGCILSRDVPKDEVISLDDVEQPNRGAVDKLWQEQMQRWPQVKKVAVSELSVKTS